MKRWHEMDEFEKRYYARLKQWRTMNATYMRGMSAERMIAEGHLTPEQVEELRAKWREKWPGIAEFTEAREL